MKICKFYSGSVELISLELRFLNPIKARPSHSRVQVQVYNYLISRVVILYRTFNSLTSKGGRFMS
ncbi:MAG: hypothetical protein QOK84_09535, partial [Nitrososphaeraceae archaeon]|nr:hypothetical protein [Nitrososphaeraceae archaeon]